MKKLICALLALGLITAFIPAMAREVRWTDVAPTLEASGLKGEFVTFDEANVRIWVPDGFGTTELGEAELDDGYVAWFVNSDESAAIGVQYIDLEDETFDDYRAEIAREGLSDITRMKVNGFDCIYSLDREGDARYLAFETAPGLMLLVSCEPADWREGIWRAVGSSIQRN